MRSQSGVPNTTRTRQDMDSGWRHDSRGIIESAHKEAIKRATCGRRGIVIELTSREALTRGPAISMNAAK